MLKKTLIALCAILALAIASSAEAQITRPWTNGYLGSKWDVGVGEYFPSTGNGIGIRIVSCHPEKGQLTLTIHDTNRPDETTTFMVETGSIFVLDHRPEGARESLLMQLGRFLLPCVGEFEVVRPPSLRP